MVNYQNGKIYALVSNVAPLRYIGSTTQPLHKRKADHIDAHKRWKEGKRNYVSSFDIIEAGDFDIVLLEGCAVENKEELYAKERSWIESAECVNKRVPTRTHKERYEANKEAHSEKMKLYYEANKDAYSKNGKAYYQANKEAYSKKGKAYYEANKEAIRKKHKAHHARKQVSRHLEDMVDQICHRFLSI